MLFTFKKPLKESIYSKECFVIVALSWFFLSIFGSLPFILSGSINSFIDAFFESASGFTTTGASIINNVEILPKCILFWRTFTHWIGGMGVLVFLLAFLPISGGGNIYLMKAESTGPSVGKLVPRLKTTAGILYLLYFLLTTFEFIALKIGGLNWFEAITAAFVTAGTGGFGIKNSSIAAFPPRIQ
ncbi:MAG: TrkH family potassium uptake protein, partial [Clostridia bacterium]|nr:TrkH family potassium uptake protein [Clostridia bacterium]